LPPSQGWNDADCDGDGVTNGDEILDGTDPLNTCDFVLSSQTVPPIQTWNDIDCDGDGVSNGQEVLDGTDPLDLCSYNWMSQEIHYGVDAYVDGVSQAWLDADCDCDGVGDGILNGEEIADANDNGIPDYAECNNNVDPNDDGIVIYDILIPNGNGLNDVFVITGLDNYPDNVVQIYNRWGVMVYETEHYGTRDNFFRGYSDGRVTVDRGARLPVGTYYYILNYVNKNGETKRLAGPLYINRK
jgi:gliding motility-associated-like protein